MKSIRKLTVMAGRRILWAGVAAMMLAADPVPGQTTNNYNFSFSPTAPIPAGDLNGLALSTNLSGMEGTIASLTVSLDITNGFNGNLYMYLVGPNGGFAVLLNRVGVGDASAYGYSDAGFDITLSDASTQDVHFYQTVSYTLNNAGQLTGTWMPDGMNIDPQSPPSAFETAGQTALLSSFDGTNPDGNWILYSADVVSGPQSTVVGWDLSITTVPEPAAMSLFGLGGVYLFAWQRHRSRN